MLQRNVESVREVPMSLLVQAREALEHAVATVPYTVRGRLRETLRRLTDELVQACWEEGHQWGDYEEVSLYPHGGYMPRHLWWAGTWHDRRCLVCGTWESETL